ncbi:hypothetical protein BJY52DRAFT_1282426 [Lactarius psammicola]|nr:hypothetical protein BJY52DRAFT_1282426 [Lactarius psammicola]
MAATLPLGTRMPMVRGHRPIRAPGVMRLGGRWTVDAMTRSGDETTGVRVTREPQLSLVTVGTPREEACLGTVASLTSFLVCIAQFGLSPPQSVFPLGNGGDGGDASSGSAYAHGGGSKAFSGPGGDASGGSVNEGKHRREYRSILKFASGAYAVLVFSEPPMANEMFTPKATEVVTQAAEELSQCSDAKMYCSLYLDAT